MLKPINRQLKFIKEDERFFLSLKPSQLKKKNVLRTKHCAEILNKIQLNISKQLKIKITK